MMLIEHAMLYYPWPMLAMLLHQPLKSHAHAMGMANHRSSFMYACKQSGNNSIICHFPSLLLFSCLLSSRLSISLPLGIFPQATATHWSLHHSRTSRTYAACIWRCA